MSIKIKAAIIALMILSLGTVAAIELHKTVLIEINEQIIPVSYWGFTVGDALTSAQVSVFEGDVVTPALDEWISENQIIEIQRAAWIIILKGNEEHTLWTTERKPITLLKIANLELNPGDIVFYRGNQVDVEQKLPFSPVITLKIKSGTTIELTEGESEVDIFYQGTTIMDALWDAGIRKFVADSLEPSPQTQLMEEKIRVVLHRSKEVIIAADDVEIKTRVLALTVGDALAEAGISLQDMDYSIPAEDSTIPESRRIEIVRLREAYLIEQELIPFGIEYLASQDIDLDT